MAEIAPEVLDLLEQVRGEVLNYENAEEYAPWGSRAFFRDLKGRNFLFVTEQPDYLEVSLRIPPAEREKAFSLPFVEIHKYLDSRGWITARIHNEEEFDQIIPWLKLSYDLNKPFRSKDDYLPGENTQVLDFLEQVRQVANDFGDIEEYFPFGDRAFRRRKGQIFLYASEQDDSLYINVRLPMGERDYALSLPNVDIPRYIGHKGWIGAKVKTQEDLDMVIPWIAISYEMNQPARKSKAKK